MSLGIRSALAVSLAISMLSIGCRSPGAPASTSKLPGPAKRPGAVRPLHSQSLADGPPGVVPGAVTDALLPPVRIESPPSDYSFRERFDVTVNAVDAAEFFMSLVDGTSYNIVLDPTVGGEVSLRLKNVTIEEVMAAMRDVYGFEYQKTSYGYHVMPPGLQTRIFHMNYLNVDRVGISRTLVSSGQVTQATGGGSSSDDEGSSGGSKGGVSGSAVSTSSSTNLWEELTTSLTSMIGTKDGRLVVASPSSGVLTVRATPAELREVERFLTTIERSLNRQVILEAKIIEVTLSDSYQSGINWAQLLQPKNSTDIVIGQGLSDLASLNDAIDRTALGKIDNSGTVLGGVFSTLVGANNFAAFIEILETQGSVRTLSSPRVSTVNNQKAVIKVGQDEYFVTEVSATTTTGTSTTTTPEIELTPFFSGIALDVTPQISADGGIVLHIHPSISEVVDQTKVISVFGVDQSLPLALSTIRESDSIVRVQSGEIVVLGGLMQEISKEKRAGTPWLSRIPFLGVFFRHQGDSSAKTELVILLRVVMTDPETWTEALGRTTQRIDALDRVRPARRWPGHEQPRPAGEL